MGTRSNVTIREDYFAVSGDKSIPHIRMEEKIRRTIGEAARLISKEKIDSVRFEVANNWGNRIYMNRATGNKLYLAFVRGQVKTPASVGVLDSFAAIRAITDYLDSIGAQYCIGRELTASV